MTYRDRTGRPLVAIVGMAGLFPGSSTLSEFWENVVAGRDCSTEVPPGRWLIPPGQAFAPEIGRLDRVYSTRGYFLSEIPTDFSGHDVDAELLRQLDPSVHLAIHLARTAWASAITSHVDPSRCGVILGHIALPTESVSRLAREILEPLFESGTVGSPITHGLNRFVAGLPALMAARALGLGLGGLALDAACASSLYAVKLAIDELQAGRADAMIAGGLSRPDCLYTQMGFAQLRALSMSGRCSPFDKSADGLVVGEGGGAVVLKRLDDAMLAGDNIVGVIAGIGLSNDREGNLLAPSSEGQLRAMRAAYLAAEWRPNEVSFIECHATGTPLGDAVEYRSLCELWGDASGDCVLGAVKATVGHLLTGAGAAGLIKMLLAMRHGVRPPLTNFDALSNGVKRNGTYLTLSPEPSNWPTNQRRVAISAFGFGGINAHLLVQDYLPANNSAFVDGEPPREAIAIVGYSVRRSPEIHDLLVPVGRFAIPPREFAAMMPQQALMLLTASDAMQEAGSQALTEPDRTGVFIGCGLDLHTTDFHFRWSRPESERDEAGRPLAPDGVLGHLASITASRIARHLGVGGPSFALSNEEKSGHAALQLGIEQLSRGDISTAIVGAVDTRSDIRHRVFEDAVAGQDAAAALVLTRLKDAISAGCRIHAIVDCLDSAAVKHEWRVIENETHFGAANDLIGTIGAIEAVKNDHCSEYWLTNRTDGPRIVSVMIGNDGIATECIVVQEHESTSNDPSLPDDVLNQLKQIAERPKRTQRDRIAFVFPGAGNCYPGMGRELASNFPHVMERQHAVNRRLRDQFAAEAFWDESRTPTPVDVLMGQVAFGTLVTDILLNLGIHPDAAIGYSLGVSASFFALRAWTERDEMLRRLSSSPLFRNELAGQFDAVRRRWGRDENAPIDWQSGLIGVSGAEAQRLLRPGTYLLAINSDNECMIGGNREQVDAIVRDLGLAFVPVHGLTIAHCDVVRETERAYLELHLLPTTHPPEVAFYHPTEFVKFALTPESAAQAVLAQALHTVDFPNLIEAAYSDGIRTFVEIGPGASCTRMIGRILADRPHDVISATVHPDGEVGGLLDCVRRLRELGYPADLSKVEPRNRPPNADRTFPIKFLALPFQIKSRAGHAASGENLQKSGFGHVAGASLAIGRAHAAYLDFAQSATQHVANLLNRQQRQLQRLASSTQSKVFFDRQQCLEFATGKIGPLLGAAYAEADSFPTRVRLPDEPLMLVDRIMAVEAEPLSLSRGRVLTEHDVTADRWYLDHGRIPTCIAVEAGQADLFLSGYLGIDLTTRGNAVYRLLDAVVTFHDELPQPDSIISYDIHIDRFFRQGDTHLFRFRFEGTVNGRPLLTMTDGCAGFFTDAELKAGQGIIQTALDRRQEARSLPEDWATLAACDQVETYDEIQLDCLRTGDLAGCFGPQFRSLSLESPTRLPSGRMRLVHRITHLDRRGGRFGLGLIRGEAHVHPDDWYLTCHFVDDMVMPGTLMYECCLHTLRVFLMRLGWVGEHGEVSWQPVPAIASKLKCRGQVVATTKAVTYEVTLKELGYRPEPYAVADVLMYADGKPIVEIGNMSVQFAGMNRQRLIDLWTAADVVVDPEAGATRAGQNGSAPVFDHNRILAFAVGKPSEAFGDRYRVFDSERVIARLPGPPYQFLDRIVGIDGPQWAMKAGTTIEAEYDVPHDAWYFDSYRRPLMPFAVLLETALQPCGWLAAYMGSALTSDTDLSFRNLGGKAVQRQPVHRDTGTLVTTVEAKSISSSGGMVIQHYDFSMQDGRGNRVYDGSTYFGFFTKTALAEQIGIREPAIWSEPRNGERFPFRIDPPFPDDSWRMIDQVASFVPEGGPAGLGFIEGTKQVNPSEWFFAAHFFQDPVMPGSLGLEAFLQLVDVVADRRWGPNPSRQIVAIGQKHEWVYRGQVIPEHGQVTIRAWVNTISDDARTLTASGDLAVDGRLIYKMIDFSVQG